MTNNNQSVVVFWFRRDLRLEDNVGLYHALQSKLPVLPLFIFDTDILSQLNDKHDKRVDFIHQSLLQLQNVLHKNGSSMVVKVGNPLEVFEKLCRDFNIKAVYTNRDYEQYAIERDKTVEIFLQNKQIDFCSFKDQVIFEWNEVLKSNGEPYTIFTPYSNEWKQKFVENEHRSYPSEKLFENLIQTEKQQIPELHEIGFSKTEIVFNEPKIDQSLIQHYDKTRNFPAIKGSSELSVHLRFGTVSIRKLVSIAAKLNETWLNELIWRDFFMSILVNFPHVEKGPFKKQYSNIAWRNDEAEFARWCEGTTGYPIVDAGMRQLNETGWMHNRVRMITASFLTKHLLIDWRWGEAYFASKLLDYDLAANNGNWQWAAGCGCDAAPYFRVFNPAEQTKRFDPELSYIRSWLKEFGSSDYPQPIVEHSFARQRALETYKKALI